MFRFQETEVSVAVGISASGFVCTPRQVRFTFVKVNPLLPFASSTEMYEFALGNSELKGAF